MGSGVLDEGGDALVAGVGGFVDPEDALVAGGGGNASPDVAEHFLAVLVEHHMVVDLGKEDEAGLRLGD